MDQVNGKKKRRSNDKKEAKMPKTNEVKPQIETVAMDDEMDGSIILGEFISESEIVANDLQPQNVLHITHVKNDAKNLVVLIKFDGCDDPAYVYSKWANEHCPQLVIAYYEQRIRWYKTS